MEIDNLLEFEKREDLRQWLQAHHTVATHCWVETYRSRKPKSKSLPYHEVVEEALCFVIVLVIQKARASPTMRWWRRRFALAG